MTETTLRAARVAADAAEAAYHAAIATADAEETAEADAQARKAHALWTRAAITVAEMEGNETLAQKLRIFLKTVE